MISFYFTCYSSISSIYVDTHKKTVWTKTKWGERSPNLHNNVGHVGFWRLKFYTILRYLKKGFFFLFFFFFMGILGFNFDFLMKMWFFAKNGETLIFKTIFQDKFCYIILHTMNNILFKFEVNNMYRFDMRTRKLWKNHISRKCTLKS